MLKVAPCTVLRSYGRTSKFFRLDGLLLFCIVMELRYYFRSVITLPNLFVTWKVIRRSLRLIVSGSQRVAAVFHCALFSGKIPLRSFVEQVLDA